MYTPNRRGFERWPTPTIASPRPNRLPPGPIYHVYSHYGCPSEQIDRCAVCKYLLQENTYLHSNPQSLVAATTRSVLPPIERQPSPSPIQSHHYRIDDRNDIYILQDIPGSRQTRREAEDAAIINICLKDKSIERIILIDGDIERQADVDDDNELYVRLYELEKGSH